MATLKKGILGTPRGKIRNLMGYTRYGKGVIQAVPTVKDKEARIWNIYQANVRSELTYVWNNMASLFQTPWISNAPPNMTGLEYYLSQNMEIFNVDKVNTIANGLFNRSNNFGEIIAIPSMDYDTEILQLTILDQFQFFDGSPTQRVRIYAYNDSNTGTSLLYNFPNTIDREFFINVSGIMNPSRQYLTYQLERTSPVQSTRRYICNPLRRT